MDQSLGPILKKEKGKGWKNSIFHAVEGGPLEQEIENVIIRTQTDQYAQKEVIREDKEDMDMEEEGEGGEIPPPQLTCLPEKKK